MESPTPAYRHSHRLSKKRGFPGGSSSSSFKDAQILETTPSKHKKVVSEIIDVDLDEDVMIIDGNAYIKGKAKDKGKGKGKGKVVSEIIDVDLEEDVMLVHGNTDRKGKGKGKETSSNFLSGATNDGTDKVEQNLCELFKKFDTVEDCSDHHYFVKGSSKQVNPSKGWAKRIQKEWKILEEHLPDTIFVRVYESRMDLLRAVIIGAEGTPYHNGLFFFDVFFPKNYPRSPPEVYYHSGGLSINPNLYSDGTVCLSLLNTWDGSERESWLPKESTMLQVLVSVQGLILNVKPYFNEPGFDSSEGTEMGEQSSLQYSEEVFVDSLRTMVYSMERPPKHFEVLVTSHFCMHARDILVSCKAYSEGAHVGFLVGEGNEVCSQHFRTSVAGFITTLVNSFSKIGAKDCNEFLSLARKAKTFSSLTCKKRF